MAMNNTPAPASFHLPPTQNTAPVWDFRCLWTSDLRRKQKRWQDGRLKFHTFNKRVMVYDDRSNTIGDTHWKASHDLAEGEEIQLDRGGILVEVQECMGKNDQDLTELIDKRLREKEERRAIRSAASPIASAFRGPVLDRLPPSKSLKGVLGTTLGHHGRAVVPVTPPFERRCASAVASPGIERERPGKRRKVEPSSSTGTSYAQNLTGVTLDLSHSAPLSSVAKRQEPFRLKTINLPPQKSIIDLTKDDDDCHAGDIGTGVMEPSKQKSSRPKSQRNNEDGRKTYAGALTGATLNLGGPSFSRSKASQAQQKSRQAHVEAVKPMLDNTTLEEVCSRVVPGTYDVPGAKNIKDHRPFAGTKPLAHSSIVPGNAKVPALIMTKEHGNPRDTMSSTHKSSNSNQDQSFTEADESQLTLRSNTYSVTSTGARSSLRIIPRPPRNKLMFLSLPSASTELHPSKGRRLNDSNPKLALEDTVPDMSQASRDLYSLQQRQRSAIQERLCTKTTMPSPSDSICSTMSSRLEDNDSAWQVAHGASQQECSKTPTAKSPNQTSFDRASSLELEQRFSSQSSCAGGIPVPDLDNARSNCMPDPSTSYGVEEARTVQGAQPAEDEVPEISGPTPNKDLVLEDETSQTAAEPPKHLELDNLDELTEPLPEASNTDALQQAGLAKEAAHIEMISGMPHSNAESREQEPCNQAASAKSRRQFRAPRMLPPAKGQGPTIRMQADSLERGPWSREAFDLFGSWCPPDRLRPVV